MSNIIVDFYTPKEAEDLMRKLSIDRRAPFTEESLRTQAHVNPSALGFPVCVVGSRVLIPAHSFKSFWGIPEDFVR